ncbi:MULTISPECIES: hypothetical protein [unclassified Methylobacterium]|jgi:hypothetical protein|uniref:hypothetical protein n=1 Tax=unclassified Methylobacterium TaxID=2615210 RepID=UPI001352AA19|nr:hypothetical protein [Methylobacterium sp. 2A]MWV25860.1 hypothetical protein [Methylobacterium sp. 2A]
MALRETIERLKDPRGYREEPADIVAKWKAAVSKLYDDIATWLKPYLDDGSLVLKRVPKPVHEEATGPYEIDVLDIEIGAETVRLDPKGTVVIGALGRIDMSHLGSGDPLFLVLTGPPDQPIWNLVKPSERRRATVLTKETFEATLDDLLAAYSLQSGPGI